MKKKIISRLFRKRTNEKGIDDSSGYLNQYLYINMIVPVVFTVIAFVIDVAAVFSNTGNKIVAVIASGFAFIVWALYWAIFLHPRD